MKYRTALALLLLPCAACLPWGEEMPPRHEVEHLDALVRRERIGAVLMRTAPEDFAGLDVIVAGDSVTLRGEVPSEEAREMAGHLTRSVGGVNQVINEVVVVERSRPEQREEAEELEEQDSPPR